MTSSDGNHPSAARRAASSTAGRHWLIELAGCERALLNDAGRLRQLLVSAATAAGTTPVAEVFHPFAPHGVTGVVVIEESHLSIHTWPETGYAAVDFYTCGDARLERALAVLTEALAPAQVDVLEVTRGLAPAAGALRAMRKAPGAS